MTEPKDAAAGKPQRRFTLTRAIVLFVLVEAGVFTLGAFFTWWHWITQYRLTPVRAGVLYRAAEMPWHDLLATCRRLDIRTVLDLRTDEDLAADERAALESIGVRHVHVPSNQVPKPHVVEAFLNLMDDPVNYPVLVHCTHGVGRTGVCAALYRIEHQGWPNERARREAMFLAGMDSFRLGTGKGDFIHNYTPSSEKPQPR
jgi:protein tyrosine phosphatase (PTP) superfamily phosphohydrolase (DUF442 family)